MGVGGKGAGNMIEIISLWRNDAGRRLEDRVEHLLSKSSRNHPIVWSWYVGDSDDDTLELLDGLAHRNVNVRRADTGIEGGSAEVCRQRGSATATKAFSMINSKADFVLLHESDLLSPPDVIDRLLDAGGGELCAGWPEIQLSTGRQFYDVWAYRDLEGRPFAAHAPHVARWAKVRHAPFRVGSFGSVWIAPAELITGRVIETRAILELCEQWKSEGVPMWVDPAIKIEQPIDLWNGG